MLRDTPCGKERLSGHYRYPAGMVPMFTERLDAGDWFVFTKVDIEVPKALWPKFEEIPPFFFTKQTRDEVIPRYMKDYVQRTGRKRGDKQSW